MRETAGSIDVQYQPEDKDFAVRLLAAAEDCLERIEGKYHLRRPRRVRLVVLTSWFRFPFQTAPAYLQPSVVLFMPFWAFRSKRIWPWVGGWQQSYPGGTAAIGIKPPRLIERSDHSLGEQLFKRLDDPWQKSISLLAHELAHACSHHLRLPAWLNEGLAMAAADHVLEVDTVLPHSRDLINAERLSPKRIRQAVLGRDHEALLALYASGYWLVRWLETSKPELLVDLLSSKHRPKLVQSMLEDALGCQTGELWACVQTRFGPSSSQFY